MRFFYKASSQGSYFDGRDHLDRLQVEQNRIAERVARDHMMRQYAQETGMTHRALFREMGGEREGENAEAEEFLDLDDDRQSLASIRDDQNYTRAELEGVLGRAGEAQQANQGAIAQAHQQHLEQEQEQGVAVLNGLVKKVARSVEFLRRKWCDFLGRGLLACSLKNGTLQIWTLGGKWLAG